MNYRLTECLVLWAAVMQGRWPRKKAAIKATVLHYLHAAKLHDSQHVS